MLINLFNVSTIIFANNSNNTKHYCAVAPMSFYERDKLIMYKVLGLSSIALIMIEFVLDNFSPSRLVVSEKFFLCMYHFQLFF